MFWCESLAYPAKSGRRNKMSEKESLSHERKKPKELMIDNEKKKYLESFPLRST